MSDEILKLLGLEHLNKSFGLLFCYCVQKASLREVFILLPWYRNFVRVDDLKDGINLLNSLADYLVILGRVRLHCSQYEIETVAIVSGGISVGEGKVANESNLA